MSSHTERERPQEDQEAKPERWSQVLSDVVQERETGMPWWKSLGIFVAWAGGFAGTAAAAAAILLLIVDLFSAGRRFTARTLSDWIFWVSALLMVIGLLAPTERDPDSPSKKQDQKDEDREARASRALRRRLRRVYDPWRWRLWASALLAFGLSVLVGLLARP